MANVNVKSLLVLLYLVQIGACYQCYRCIYLREVSEEPANRNSTITTLLKSIPGLSKQMQERSVSDCGDPVTTGALDKMDCGATDMECGKVSATFEDDDDPSIIVRSCMPTWTCNIFAECDTCDEELCNSSTNLMPSFVIISMLGLISVKYLL